jgi:hypothetical protein
VLPFGVPTWAIYFILAAAALGALWYAYDTVDGRGFDRGRSWAEKAYAERDNKALREALARVQQLQAEVQAREQTHSEALGRIQHRHHQETAHANRQHQADLAAVRAGTLKLRDPGSATGPACGDRGAAAAAAVAAGGSDAAPRAELSGATAEFLLALTSDADAVTRQLTSAQQVIRAQIEACNGP